MKALIFIINKMPDPNDFLLDTYRARVPDFCGDPDYFGRSESIGVENEIIQFKKVKLRTRHREWYEWELIT